MGCDLGGPAAPVGLEKGLLCSAPSDRLLPEASSSLMPLLWLPWIDPEVIDKLDNGLSFGVAGVAVSDLEQKPRGHRWLQPAPHKLRPSAVPLAPLAPLSLSSWGPLEERPPAPPLPAPPGPPTGAEPVGAGPSGSPAPGAPAGRPCTHMARPWAATGELGAGRGGASHISGA